MSVIFQATFEPMWLRVIMVASQFLMQCRLRDRRSHTFTWMQWDLDLLNNLGPICTWKVKAFSTPFPTNPDTIACHKIISWLENNSEWYCLYIIYNVFSSVLLIYIHINNANTFVCPGGWFGARGSYEPGWTSSSGLSGQTQESCSWGGWTHHFWWYALVALFLS